MGAWTTKMESNLPKVLQQLARSGRVGLHMITVRTGPGDTRTADQNYKILAIQRALFKRDPWFLTPAEAKQLGEMTRAAMDAADPQAELNKICPDVGRQIVRYFKDHVDRWMSRHGKTPANSAARQRRKGSKPPLRDTDELYNSLTFAIERVT